MFISEDIKYIGVDDHMIDLFESLYPVPDGMAYNSYVIIDDKIAVMDTVEEHFGEQWLCNLKRELGDRTPDYLIVQHMEPDHSANVSRFMEEYPSAVVVASAAAANMMKGFFGTDYSDRRISAADGEKLTLGKHTLNFMSAAMIHWPEVIMTYDETDKVLFSADAFGAFGALDVEKPWDVIARSYYFGIVGKYGMQVQNFLKKARTLDINTICSLHGPIIKENLQYCIDLYNTWSAYEAEREGVFIAYASIYGNTRKAVMKLSDMLRDKGCTDVVVSDLAREHWSDSMTNAFRYNKIIIASPTYNGGLFPPVREFIDHLSERGFKNRIIGVVENGTWAPAAAAGIKKMLEACKDITFVDTSVKIMSALNDTNLAQLEALAEEIASK